MRKIATYPDQILTKSKRPYYELIDWIVNAKTSRLPLTEEAAQLNQVNINTIKVVYGSLIPLRITPPMEQLLNFTLIARETQITLAVISEHIRERIGQTYPHIVKDFCNFKIYTLSKILSNHGLIKNTRISLTFKQTYREDEELFLHIPKIVTYNRFHNEEGLNQIRSLI
ncbi:MAG: hypothetical protein OQK50_08515 [Deltaproteobacteria bacterium]|nr:hypothetical protein [Deltaproteobacteria bacterium]